MNINSNSDLLGVQTHGRNFKSKRNTLQAHVAGGMADSKPNL
jgi:hypothetical protein